MWAKVSLPAWHYLKVSLPAWHYLKVGLPAWHYLKVHLFSPFCKFTCKFYECTVANKGHALTLTFQTFSTSFTWNQVSLMRFPLTPCFLHHLNYCETTESFEINMNCWRESSEKLWNQDYVAMNQVKNYESTCRGKSRKWHLISREIHRKCLKYKSERMSLMGHRTNVHYWITKGTCYLKTNMLTFELLPFSCGL